MASDRNLTPTWAQLGPLLDPRRANPTCNLQVFCNISCFATLSSSDAPRWPQDGPKSPQGDPKTMPYRASSRALRELLGSLGRLSEPSSSHRGSLQKPIAQMSKKRHPSGEKCTFGVCWGAPKTAPRRLKKVSKTARYNNSRLVGLDFSSQLGLP